MEPISLKKYKVRLFADSKKTQGLQIGDIVRRQCYVDGILSYTMMCVVDTGIDVETNAETGQAESKPYFIGVKLEGDDLISDTSNPAYQKQVLDFVRITNLFDLNRSGALYLTANDEESPYMDIVDGVGRNGSVCWPEGLHSEAFPDTKSQYNVAEASHFNISYSQHHDTDTEYQRVLRIERTTPSSGTFEGVIQNFYEPFYVGEKVIISYRARCLRSTNLSLSFGYANQDVNDAEWTENLTANWKYCFAVVNISKSGRHLRSFKMGLQNLALRHFVEIADLNIIPLSCISNFSNASVSRIGKLDGIKDSVFGNLTGYGAHIKKLYASESAHISGTLTAGDENGFGATFYAGKIHRNCFINSMTVNFTSAVNVDTEISNPTGIGQVYRASNTISMIAQTVQWLIDHDGEVYCFSFWAYMGQPGKLTIYHNGNAIGDVVVDKHNAYTWNRYSVRFYVKAPSPLDDMKIAITPWFDDYEYDTVAGDVNPNRQLFYFSAPQLESGDCATQYQATDDVLNDTAEYGAWFNRGGIGGTMQNPLLQLNFKDDNGIEGGIGTQSRSLLLRQDGSGYLANKNIQWDTEGNVEFGQNVTLNWSNLSDDIVESFNGSISIAGDNVFHVSEGSSSPEPIRLNLIQSNVTSSSAQRQWYYYNGLNFIAIEDANGLYLDVNIDCPWWVDDSYCLIKCEVTVNGRILSSEHTLRKEQEGGYRVVVTSSNGTIFRNGRYQTTLTANVYKGDVLIPLEDACNQFTFKWYSLVEGGAMQGINNSNAETPNVYVFNRTLGTPIKIICQIS